MLNQTVGEPRAESVDIKEYLAVLLKRKWLVLVCFLLSMAGTTAFLFTRQPIYRASAKLLITYAGSSMPTSEVTREDEGRFDIPRGAAAVGGLTAGAIGDQGDQPAGQSHGGEPP